MGKKKTESVRAYVSISLKHKTHEKTLKSAKFFKNLEKVDENHFLAMIEAKTQSHAMKIIEKEITAIAGVLSAVPLLFASN